MQAKRLNVRHRAGTMSVALAIALFAPTAFAQQTRPADSTDISSSVDLRPNFKKWNLRQKKQGARGTCSVFTVVGAIEYALARQSGKGTALSEEYLNWACNQVIRNKTRDRGQFFSDLIKGYERHGICEEKEMPYKAAFDPEYSPSAGALDNARGIKQRALKIHWIKPWSKSVGIDDEQIEKMKATLRDGWPVCAGSYHSLLVVGYRDAVSLPGGGEFLLRDSGGKNEKVMSYEAAKKRLGDVLWFESELPQDDAAAGSPAVQ